MVGEHYRIEKVGDFLKVPPDRLELCLKEFKASIDMHRGMDALVQIVGKESGIPEGTLTATMPCFTWIDDDLGEYGIRMSYGEVKNDRV